MLNTQIWASNTAAGVYFNGYVLFVNGLAIVQNHNIWRLRWTTLITLVGWGSIALGLMRMVTPEKILEKAMRMSREQLMLAPGLLLPVGIWLTVKGFF
jgi:hypothetical protein